MITKEIKIKVSLDDFSEEDIISYAENELGMFSNWEEIEDCLLLEELSSRGIGNFDIYDSNILYSAALENISANLESIPVQEFENLIKKYNL